MICGLLQSFFNMSTKLTFLCLETLGPRCELFQYVYAIRFIRRRNKIYFGLLCPLRRNAVCFNLASYKSGLGSCIYFNRQMYTSVCAQRVTSAALLQLCLFQNSMLFCCVLYSTRTTLRQNN